MSRKKSYVEDPVVEEVREARRRLWKEAGGNFEGLIKLLDRTIPREGKKKTRVQRSRAKRK